MVRLHGRTCGCMLLINVWSSDNLHRLGATHCSISIRGDYSQPSCVGSHEHRCDRRMTPSMSLVRPSVGSRSFKCRFWTRTLVRIALYTKLRPIRHFFSGRGDWGLGQSTDGGFGFFLSGEVRLTILDRTILDCGCSAQAIGHGAEGNEHQRVRAR